jgi:hypothetical protein
MLLVDQKRSRYFTTRATTMLLTSLIIVAVTPIGSAGAHSKPGVPVSPDSNAEKRCFGIAGAYDWPNPYIGVNTTKDVFVIAPGASIPKDEIPLKELGAYLEQLPKTAWPRGRVVAAQQSGISIPDDRRVIRRNCRKVNRVLRRLKMKANWWTACGGPPG